MENKLWTMITLLFYTLIPKFYSDSIIVFYISKVYAPFAMFKEILPVITSFLWFVTEFHSLF